ncbi:MAG: hypothetical protein KJT01_04170 [Gemmatimonadetes bacterium]|nr:hypothetical protein [Gemmatimonadota bacterium]
MHQQSSRQLQERVTALPVPEVLAAAEAFFARRGGVYTAFVERRGPGHVALRGQGNEEVVIGARSTEAGTVVTGSTYFFDQQVARFLDGLPPAPPVPSAPQALPAGAGTEG